MTERQFEGRSAAEAAIKACEVLGVTRSALRYKVVSEVGEQLNRRVVIVVDVEAHAAAAQAHSNDEGSEGATGAGRSERRPAGERQPRASSDRSERGDRPASDRGERGDRPASDRGERGERPVSDRGERVDRPASDRGERGDRPASDQSDRSASSGDRGRGRRREGGATASSSPRRSGRDRDRGDGPRRSARGGDRERGGAHAGHDDDGIEALLKLDAQPVTPVTPRPDIVPQGERAKRALTLAGDLSRLLQLDAVPHVVGEDDAEIHVDMHGRDGARLIGKKGEVLLAFQFLMNRILSRQEDGDQVVVLDAGGYRERRRNALAELAKRLASRALQERKAVRLSPMSAHDRRIFHMTLKEVEGVTTRSEGDGLYRNLLIIPSEFC